VSRVRRRLELIILGHIWALTPLLLVWFFFPAWRGGESPLDVRALTVLASLTAIYLLLRSYLTIKARAPGANLLWPYLEVAIITAVLIVLRNPVDALSILYFIPLASAVASLSARHLAGLVTAITAGYVLVILISDVPWSVTLVFRLVMFAAIASLYGWLIRTVTASARAAERAEFQAELSREIHDGIQHLLVTMGTRLELASHLITESPGRAAQIVTQEREAARRAADELRYLVRRLRAEAEHTDLASVLRIQVAAMAERWPFELEVEVPTDLPRLPPAVEHAILRVIQESLTNAAKHGAPERVDVRLSRADQSLHCAIKDDGRGFDPRTPGVEEGGLHYLQTRVASAGGTLEVRSAPGQGTLVVASFPIPEVKTWTKLGS
jgi:signal transduction histidine kinase